MEDEDVFDWDAMRKKRRGDARCCLEIELSNGERVHLLFCALNRLFKWSGNFDALANDFVEKCFQRCSICSCCVTVSSFLFFDVFAVATSRLSAETAFWVAFLGFPASLGLVKELTTRRAELPDTLLFIGLTGVLTSMALWWWTARQQASAIMLLLVLVPIALLWKIFQCRFAGANCSSSEGSNTRSKVCSWCEVERIRFDHHCIWINSCVHANTHRSFMIFLVLAIICAFSFAGVVLGPAVQSTSSGLWAGLERIHADAPIMFVVAIMDFSVGCNVMVIFSMQLHCIATNVTINEFFNRKRYFEQEGRPRPVSLGCWRNCIAFWKGCSVPSHVWSAASRDESV